MIFRGLSRRDALDAAARRPPAAVSTKEAAAARLAKEGTAEGIRELDFDALGEAARACTRCLLHESRKNVVFGEGDLEARVVCVGEAPGAVEDDTGRPFVGRAGQLLDLLLMSVGLRRDEVYICNVLKCRPPGNRDPSTEEIATCSPFLLRQIELIDPEVVVAFGRSAAQTLLSTRDSIGGLRGRTHLYGRYPLVVTYHPAASLRNPGWKRPTWEDLQLVRRVLDGDSPSASGPAADEPFLNLRP